jgi:hypothetical protein
LDVELESVGNTFGPLPESLRNFDPLFDDRHLHKRYLLSICFKKLDVDCMVTVSAIPLETISTVRGRDLRYSLGIFLEN